MRFEIHAKVPVFGIKFDPAFPHLKDALVQAGDHIRNTWIRIAESEMNRATGEYIDQLRSFAAMSYTDDGFGVIVTNYAKHARIIEEGYAAFRLPEKVNWGGGTPKMKWTKAGTPYLTIPFRHFTPAKATGGKEGRTYRSVKQAMPKEIYEYAKQLKRSLDIRQPQINPVTGRVNTKTLWGGRLTPQTTMPRVQGGLSAGRWMTAGFYGGGAGGSPFISKLSLWKFSKYAGMVKTRTAGHTRYMTFRTLTPQSEGWNIPGQYGKHIAEKTRNEVAETIQQIIQTAIMRDVAGGITIEERHA